MRPSTRELINAIVTALESQVAPAVQDDKWAASVLRSTTQLLNHLAVRTEEEVRVLQEDNEDARRVLMSLAPRLASVRAAEKLSAATEAALSKPDPAPCDGVGLDARNEAYQAAVEQLVKHRDILRQVTGSDAARDELRAYLKRRLEREHHLYFPVFMGPPF
ncbi:MAG: hypothetical protein ABW034_17225 [Steroidobacteraceae bacterium]